MLRPSNRGRSETCGICSGQQGGANEKPSVPKCSEGLWETLQSSLAVFYVEQVALNRHVSPQPQLLLLCPIQSGKSIATAQSQLAGRSDHLGRTRTIVPGSHHFISSR